MEKDHCTFLEILTKLLCRFGRLVRGQGWALTFSIDSCDPEDIFCVKVQILDSEFGHIWFDLLTLVPEWPSDILHFNQEPCERGPTIWLGRFPWQISRVQGHIGNLKWTFWWARSFCKIRNDSIFTLENESQNAFAPALVIKHLPKKSCWNSL